MNELLFNGTSGKQGNTVISLKKQKQKKQSSILVIRHAAEHLILIHLKMDLA